MPGFTSSAGPLPIPAAATSGAAAGTSSPSASALGPTLGSGIDLFRISGALVLCIVLGVAAIFLLRRYGFGRSDGFGTPAGRRCLTIVDTVRLAPRVMLHVVEYDERRVLLALDADGVTLLDAHSRAASEITS
ncbi:flagellar biosynthetic protein FliO [Burkholderia sp. JSH-S8]|nr:flagellar biosynthetic protein FliO [Burkholderia sp. JSH-S8]